MNRYSLSVRVENKGFTVDAESVERLDKEGYWCKWHEVEALVEENENLKRELLKWRNAYTNRSHAGS